MDLKKLLAKQIHTVLKDIISLEEMERMIETPKSSLLGDLAFPCFHLAKTLRKSPVQIAQELSGEISGDEFEKIQAVGPYVNVFIKHELLANSVLNQILTTGQQYGTQSLGNNQTIVIDFSSPNIAKPFSMGHLRSTVIGNSLGKIAEKLGYQTVKINHLGDWGTQFGKLIAAYKKWGNEDAVKQNPIQELFTLYKKFHLEAETDSTLEDQGRAWFKKMEDGDEDSLKLWQWFRDESLKEFQKIYQLLNIEFDSFSGEAFYNDKMQNVIASLQQKELLEESEGAEVVRLEKENLPPCLIQKSDGATLYATRDLAAAIYRYNHYQFSKAWYVVGHEQSIHFQQLFSVLNKMGHKWSGSMEHVPFGLYLQNGKKMSTRKGRVILLEDVLKEVMELAEKNIEEKNPNLKNKAEVAKVVGVGAILFHDLKNFRLNNIEFSLDEMLTFEGETGPYVQYTHARACSIIRKAVQMGYEIEEPIESYIDIDLTHAWEIVKLLNSFQERIQQAYNQLDPSIIAKYTLDLSKAFNKYYGKVRILDKNEGMQARLQLVMSVTIVLKEALRLIGVDAPDEM